ncbi:MAG: ACT domain-containing protein [Lachnospiraceae bacterium]|jgi:hypothetical protein
MIQQLSVFIDNQPGSLMKVTHILRQKDINLRAISTFDSPEFGILRMIVDRPEEAKKALEEQHMMVRVGRVLAVELADEPGCLNQMLEVLADGNVSVNYIYSYISETNHAPVMIFHTAYQEEARQLLNRHGFNVIDRLNEV